MYTHSKIFLTNSKETDVREEVVKLEQFPDESLQTFLDLRQNVQLQSERKVILTTYNLGRGYYRVQY